MGQLANHALQALLGDAPLLHRLPDLVLEAEALRSRNVPGPPAKDVVNSCLLW